MAQGSIAGRGKSPAQDDPRHFVIVEPAEGKTLVYWGTPQVQDALEASEWPRVYRERNEIQEHSFKGMIDHGALNINYGRKTILGPDRHHQRKQEQLESVSGDRPQAGGQEGRGPQGPTGQGGRVRVQRAWQTSGAAQAHLGDLGTSSSRRPKRQQAKLL